MERVSPRISSERSRWWTWSTSIVLGWIPSACPDTTATDLESSWLGRIRGRFAQIREADHACGRLACSPLVYYSDVHSGPCQPIRTHESSRASADDEDVYVRLGGHGWTLRRDQGRPTDIYGA